MAEESEEGVKTRGTLSPSAGLSTREGMAAEEVVVVGSCWDWACRLQGWVARRMSRGERRSARKENVGVLGLVLAIAVKEERKGGSKG